MRRYPIDTALAIADIINNELGTAVDGNSIPVDYIAKGTDILVLIRKVLQTHVNNVVYFESDEIRQLYLNLKGTPVHEKITALLIKNELNALHSNYDNQIKPLNSIIVPQISIKTQVLCPELYMPQFNGTDLRVCDSEPWYFPSGSSHRVQTGIIVELEAQQGLLVVTGNSALRKAHYIDVSGGSMIVPSGTQIVIDLVNNGFSNVTLKPGDIIGMLSFIPTYAINPQFI